MISYEIVVDDKEFNDKMQQLVAKTPMLSRLLLGRLGDAVVSESVRNYLSGQVLKRKTGTLAKSLNYKLASDWEVIIGTNVAYAAIHEFGGEIRPKNVEALKFKTADGWVTTKKVVMPARPYLAPALNAVFSSGQAQKIMDRTTQEYLVENVWEK